MINVEQLIFECEHCVHAKIIHKTVSALVLFDQMYKCVDETLSSNPHNKSTVDNANKNSTVIIQIQTQVKYAQVNIGRKY